MRLGIALAIGLLVAASAGRASETIAVPNVRVGDKWVMQGTDTWPKNNKEATWKVERLVVKVEGSLATWKYENRPPLQPGSGENRYDVASQVILRDYVSGKDEPTRFPLAVGNEWRYEYSAKTSSGIVRNDIKAKVVGWEDVTVPAGTFRVLRIEHEGSWSRDTDFARDGIIRSLTAPVEITYWYAPAAKTIVKSIRVEKSFYGGVWFRREQQLVEFSLGSE